MVRDQRDENITTPTNRYVLEKGSVMVMAQLSVCFVKEQNISLLKYFVNTLNLQSLQTRKEEGRCCVVLGLMLLDDLIF